MTGPGVADHGRDGTETLGAQLRRYRLAVTLTQEQLAEKAGISPAGVAALESGRRRAPRLTTISLLADTLDLDTAQRAALAVAAAGRVHGHTGTPDAADAAINFDGPARPATTDHRRSLGPLALRPG